MPRPASGGRPNSDDLRFAGVVAEEELLPDAVEPFELHAQLDGRLDAVVGPDRVVFGLDVPAVADVAVQPGVFLGGNPAAVRRSAGLFHSGPQSGRSQPNVRSRPFPPRSLRTS